MEKMGLSVEDGTTEMMIELAGSERKRGEWLSQVVREIHAGQRRSNDQGILERIEARLMSIEQRLERMERKLGA